MDGTMAGMVGTLSIPAGGQVSRFVNQIASLSALPSTFQGTLRMSSPQPISVVGLRRRYNESRGLPGHHRAGRKRGEIRVNAAGVLSRFATGGGYNTEFIMFTSSNALFTPTGSSLNTAFR
jgi:hypothetical protein